MNLKIKKILHPKHILVTIVAAIFFFPFVFFIPSMHVFSLIAYLAIVGNTYIFNKAIYLILSKLYNKFFKKKKILIQQNKDLSLDYKQHETSLTYEDYIEREIVPFADPYLETGYYSPKEQIKQKKLQTLEVEKVISDDNNIDMLLFKPDDDEAMYQDFLKKSEEIRKQLQGNNLSKLKNQQNQIKTREHEIQNNIMSKDNQTNEEVASELFNNSAKSKIARELLEGCNSRQDILDTIIELTNKRNTPGERYYNAMAFAYSKTSYRKQAIKAIEKYLNNEQYEAAYLNHHHHITFEGYKKNRQQIERNIHISFMYQELGKCYEGEYMFKEAECAYSKSIELTPFYAHCYIRLSKIYEKQNDLNKALSVFKQAEESPHYIPTTYKDTLDAVRTDDSFKVSIDKFQTKTQEKIEKGYVYKPRKKVVKK